ncbi:hypothetical protein L1049_011252 [Liquidambar formosana]|uniref:Uncharacterized protein n=1 Tax=Liquidambar formosana TaxID=63359 RepID=A0AAP0RWL5_LIQFO
MGRGSAKKKNHSSVFESQPRVITATKASLEVSRPINGNPYAYPAGQERVSCAINANSHLSVDKESVGYPNGDTSTKGSKEKSRAGSNIDPALPATRMNPCKCGISNAGANGNDIVVRSELGCKCNKAAVGQAHVCAGIQMEVEDAETDNDSNGTCSSEDSSCYESEDEEGDGEDDETTSDGSENGDCDDSSDESAGVEGSSIASQASSGTSMAATHMKGALGMAIETHAPGLAGGCTLSSSATAAAPVLSAIENLGGRVEICKSNLGDPDMVHDPTRLNTSAPKQWSSLFTSKRLPPKVQEDKPRNSR